MAGGCAVVAATSAAASALAYPNSPVAGALVRALADCAAVIALGLAAVPLLESNRYRADLSRRAAGPLALAAAVWLLAEVVRLTVDAAQTAGIGFWQIGVHTLADFGLYTTAGRSGLVGIAAALVVAAVAVLAPRSATTTAAALGAAAVGMAARTLAGHLSESPIGGMAVAVHALAAAVWCGVLAALVLTVTHRGQWARVLPRFSQLSLACVGVLLVAGVAGAVIRLNSPAELWTTGYGRVLAAKVVVTAILLVLAWRNRSNWLPAARAHRSSASLSQNRSLVELTIMAVAVTLAAALAVTG
ncbi:CopD family protein [Mycobacterium sp. CBMA247]|nr:CopD family protein [Mycolicibacterium sp. CBMA 329]MUL89526.1 CopD family protein [Mycolicibacterium sp. CBMA 331]MUM02718.1 CopD family protein [Mycolicibacterium sp. CBMA 334]MUM27364.1 CopD family protein [Mycolicibacterium sp. CBMA 295]MUM39042.1 CopD family protein [Mycolicibacterium sp. CBMA 247]MUM45590.1 CopD family protein [Mycolicibacterium sp. CBMA 294]